MNTVRSAVMLTPHTPDDINKLAEKCKLVIAGIHNLRLEMLGEGPKVLDLNGIKPLNFLEYLQEWTDSAQKKLRRERKKAQAIAARQEIKSRKRDTQSNDKS